ncbi:MAG: DNA-binding response regulator, partial [Fimbriimonadaceae bacterium]|nr:DNA-binding response regulator [Chitinophagales bacterium]
MHELNETNRPHQKQITKRQSEILVMVIKGMSNDQIAESLQLKLRTVKTHRER